MTDRELMQQALKALEDACGGRCNAENNPCWQRDVANALRERLAQPEQEPVAHVYLFDPNGKPRVAWDNAKSIKIGTKLYTAPQPRQWVGLTDDEKASFWRADQMTHEEWQQLFAEVEAKLQEKNA